VPRTEFLGKVSGSSQEFANFTNPPFADAPFSTGPYCDVILDVFCVFALSRESTRAGKIPCKGISAGSIQTSEGECFPLSKSRLPMASCLHPAPTVIFSVVLTSHDIRH